MAEKKQSTTPWERQEKESEQAFEAFKIYCDMGLKRTITAVADQLSKSRQLITRWNREWNWKERVRAYDNDLRSYEKAAVRKQMIETAKRQSKMAAQGLSKALAALAQKDPEEFTIKDVATFLKLCTDIENRSNETMYSISSEIEDEKKNEKSSLFNSINND